MIRGRKAWATVVAVLTVAGVAPTGAYAAPAPPEVRTATAAADAGGHCRRAGASPPRTGVTTWSGGRPSRSPWATPAWSSARTAHSWAYPNRRTTAGRSGCRSKRSAPPTWTTSGSRPPGAGSTRGDPGSGASRQAKPPAPKLPPKLPAGTVDPGEAGSYATTTTEYDLPGVKLPGFSERVEMRGVVVAPTKAPGKRPVALFLHGRHATCYVPGKDGEASGAWPCEKGSKPIPSHRGYLRDQKLLASQGYVTVSISANGINGQDWQAEDGGAQARSSLIRNHLGRWADWAAKPASAPAALRKTPKADLSRVLLVGHSRGGEGVNRAVMDSLYQPPAAQDGYRSKARWNIRGTVHIGPTLFGHNPVPDVPSLTILPGCDGDVADLQGQVFTDGTRGVSRGKALHSSVYVVGANHNYFNTEWTPGQAKAPADDDFWHDEEAPDPLCSPGAAGRLTADQQHKAGATYIAAAARLFVGGDDRVRQLVDGTGRRAPPPAPPGCWPTRSAATGAPGSCPTTRRARRRSPEPGSATPSPPAVPPAWARRTPAPRRTSRTGTRSTRPAAARSPWTGRSRAPSPGSPRSGRSRPRVPRASPCASPYRRTPATPASTSRSRTPRASAPSWAPSVSTASPAPTGPARTGPRRSVSRWPPRPAPSSTSAGSPTWS